MLETRRGWIRRAMGAAAVTLAFVVSAGALGASPASSQTTDTSESQDARATASRPARPLRVATYNIQHGAGLDSVVDLERVAQTLESTAAEVVGLQEVDRHWSERSDFVDQATWLAERLEMHVVYAANLDLDPLTPDAPRRQYGTAILSRYPILESQNTLLPRPEGGEQRGLLEALLMVRGAKVRVFNTHLQHNSQLERLAQIEQIRARLAEVVEPVVLLGDLNARPDSQEITEITQDLADTWVLVGEGEGYTYHASNPDRRIDYVLSSSDVVANTAVVMTSEASDHLPVVVDLTLPAGSRKRPMPA